MAQDMKVTLEKLSIGLKGFEDKETGEVWIASNGNLCHLKCMTKKKRKITEDPSRPFYGKEFLCDRCLQLIPQVRKVANLMIFVEDLL